VSELNPQYNSLTTQRNGKISCDFLVLVPGCQMDFNLVEGVSRESLGEGNVHSIYDFKSAALCCNAIKQLEVKKE